MKYINYHFKEHVKKNFHTWATVIMKLFVASLTAIIVVYTMVESEMKEMNEIKNI